jgi:hypothetical protein
MHGCNPLPVTDLMQELPASSPQEVNDMIQTVKRKLQRELPEVVAETVEEPSDVGDEIAALRALLSI